MKTLKIIERTILVRTGQRRFPYKKERQVTIVYDKEPIAQNHYVDINNPRLKVEFEVSFKTKSEERLQKYIDNLGRTNVEKWIKEQLNKLGEMKQYILQVTDLCNDDNYYIFNSLNDLNKGVKLINTYADEYDYSDKYGGFYGQVSKKLKQANIPFKYTQKELETEYVVELDI